MSLPARLRAFGISKALDYLERDPDANLPKLMDWLDKYTGERLASPYRELFHRAMSDPGQQLAPPHQEHVYRYRQPGAEKDF